METKRTKRNISFTILISLLILGGCTVYKYSEPALPVSDIVQMSNEGVPSKDIIKDIRKSHSVYMLKADQIAELSRQGVPDSVLNYMDKTRINSVRQEERMYNYNYWGPYNYGYGWGYGWPYYGYGYGYMGPTVILHGHGGGGHYHGGGHVRR